MYGTRTTLEYVNRCYLSSSKFVSKKIARFRLLAGTAAIIKVLDLVAHWSLEGDLLRVHVDLHLRNCIAFVRLM